MYYTSERGTSLNKCVNVEEIVFFLTPVVLWSKVSMKGFYFSNFGFEYNSYPSLRNKMFRTLPSFKRSTQNCFLCFCNAGEKLHKTSCKICQIGHDFQVGRSMDSYYPPTFRTTSIATSIELSCHLDLKYT